MMDLRSMGREGSGGARRCVECKATSTPLWRRGPTGPKSLCNACGIRLRKQLAQVNKAEKAAANKGRKKKPRIQKPKPAASVSTNCSTNAAAAAAAARSTAKSAPSPPPAGFASSSAVANVDDNAGSLGKRYFFRVRFGNNKQRMVRKLSWSYQKRRTDFRRAGFYIVDNPNRRAMGEVEQAVAALLALSGRSAPA